MGGVLPDNLQRIVDDYDRLRSDEAAKQHLPLKILSSRYGGILGMGIAGSVAYVLYCFDDVASEVHAVSGIILRSLSAETARGILIRMGAWHVLPCDYDKEDPYLTNEPLENFRLTTPVGLAAGFDTTAVAAIGFLSLGFGFVEVGPVLDPVAAAARLAALPRDGPLTHLGKVGVAIAGDRVELLRAVPLVGPHVDYVAVELGDDVRAGGTEVRAVVASIVDAAALLPAGGPRVFLRLPTALVAKPAEAAAFGVLAWRGGADGLVLCGEGVSHEALVAAVSATYLATEGELVLFASGAVSSGMDALRCLEAGATAVQVSSLLVSEGPQVVRRLKNELSVLMMNEGLVNLPDVIGAAHRKRKGNKVKRNPWKAAAAPRRHAV